ncbi:MAG: NADH-quinone oxidoreductase subunit NuoE, partial [Ilumatobacteraceae bacterium]
RCGGRHFFRRSRARGGRSLMARLSDENVRLAKEIIGRYPRARSATIPLLHLAQQQDGYVTNEAMAHIGELVGATSAEVYGTASFYEMFKFEPVGKYLINICGTLSCALMGAEDLMHHAEHKLGVKLGGTTDNGMFTLERAECQAACTEAPCLQVNYRYRFRVTNADFDALVDDLAAGRLTDEIPPHGTVARVRQHIPADRGVGAVPPEDVTEAPSWMDGKAAL